MSVGYLVSVSVVCHLLLTVGKDRFEGLGLGIQNEDEQDRKISSGSWPRKRMLPKIDKEIIKGRNPDPSIQHLAKEFPVYPFKTSKISKTFIAFPFSFIVTVYGKCLAVLRKIEQKRTKNLHHSMHIEILMNHLLQAYS